MATLKYVIRVKWAVDDLPDVEFNPGPEPVDLLALGMTDEQIKGVVASGQAVPADEAAAHAADVEARHAASLAAEADADKPIAYPHHHGPGKPRKGTWEAVQADEAEDKTAKRDARAAEKAEETAHTAVQSLPLGKE